LCKDFEGGMTLGEIVESVEIAFFALVFVANFSFKVF
jgi:hypothetical protein